MEQLLDQLTGGEQETKRIPLVSTNEGEDDLRRIEDEERRIDAAIPGSERIRALKEEKFALQARKAELSVGRQAHRELDCSNIALDLGSNYQR